MATKFKELNDKIKKSKIGIAALAAGIGVTSQLSLIGLSAVALVVPLYLITVKNYQNKQSELNQACRHVKSLPNSDIWIDELSNFSVNMDVRVDSYAKFGKEWYPEYFNKPSTDPRLVRQRIKAVLGYAHAVLGVGQRAQNVNTFLEGLVLLDYNDYECIVKKATLSELDLTVLSLSRRDKSADSWLDYLHNTRTLQHTLSPDQQALITSLDLKASDINYLFDQTKVESVSIEGLNL